MTSTINSNVRMPRKMLATEIDRLDALLDGLADNLNEAVAMAVCLSILALAFPLDRGGMMKVHQDTTARLFSLQHTPRRHTLGVCPIVPNR